MNRFSYPLLFLFTFCFALSTTPVSAQTTNVDAERANVDVQKENQQKLVDAYKQLQQKSDLSAPAQADTASLDPNVIIGLLQSQPALALQVKKKLIKDALDQGRLLEEDDLTDAVLYELIRREQTIRIIATKEIMSRHYLELKPTDEEILQARVERRQVERLESSEDRREEVKQKQEDEEDGILPQASRQVPSAQGSDSSQPKRVVPSIDPSMKGRSLDERDLPRVSPSELPQLLTAAASTDGRVPATAMSMGSSVPSLGVSPSSSMTPEPMLPSEANVLSGQNEIASLQRPRNLPSSKITPEQKPFRREPNPYASVPALIDLYQQAPVPTRKLERFGSSVFANGTGNFDELPMDVPVGPDYVVGPGDGINLEMWGSVSRRVALVVDREGRVSLPEIGTVQVSGKTLAQVQQAVQSDLRSEFRDVQADVSLARLRTVRVYVVGDVVEPGAYDVSSLSTPLNALYEAGGPTPRGSMRLLKHYRGKQLVEDVDVYDLLLHGVNGDLKRLEPGDTIVVPPAHAEVALEGMVRRPALYELSQENNLAEVLELAGGVLPSGALRHIQVERLQAHENRVMLSLDLPETDSQDQVSAALAAFKVQDGDRIRVFPILPYAQKSVFLDGHVYRPGKYAYHDGMKISDLLHSYSDMLPEPSRRHAELIRLSSPDFRPMIVAFNVEEAMKGDPNSDLLLQPLDTVRIFGRYDFEDPPEITVSGEVREPGDHRTNGDLHVRDAVYLAGGLTPDAMLSDAQVFRRENGQITVKSINLARALKGDPTEDLLLHSRDRLIIHRDMAKADPPSVSIEGQVAAPGKYPLGSGMTAGELVRLAGGFKRGAYTDLADLSRYTVHDGAKVLGAHEQIEIGKAFVSHDADVPLRDGDVLTIREIAGFNDIGSMVAVKGEVMHPSVYGIKEGERLSSVLKRAGGFAPDSYPQGIVLSRDSLRQMEEKNRDDLLKRLQAETAAQKYKPGTNPAEVAASQEGLFLQEQQLVERVKNEPAIGRLVVHISGDISKWQNTFEDVELRKGDVITIPKRPTQVMVTGLVYNPTAITHVPGKNAGWYLRQAGGMNELANKKSVFVVRADGSVIGRDGKGFWKTDVQSTVLGPGDTVVVPERLLGGTPVLKTLFESAQIVSTIVISAAAAGAF